MLWLLTNILIIINFKLLQLIVTSTLLTDVVVPISVIRSSITREVKTPAYTAPFLDPALGVLSLTTSFPTRLQYTHHVVAY